VDLSLVPLEALIKEITNRLGIEILVAMDEEAALAYYEGGIDVEVD